MMKKYAKFGIGLGVLLGSFFIVYAAMRLFYSQSITSDFTKKQIFEFELDAPINALEIGPDDAFSVSPVINNTATEEMHVFIEIDMPEINGESLYEFESDENWTLIDSKPGNVVYGYGSTEMIPLQPGETTEALTTQMQMINITNAEFASIQDINLTIKGYGIDTTGNTADMNFEWDVVKDYK